MAKAKGFNIREDMRVIYTLQNGLLGVTLNGDTLNSIMEDPFMMC